MLQNNELMKKTDFTEETSGLVIKWQMGRSWSREPKKDPSASSSDAYYYCRNQGTSRKIISNTRRC